MRTFTALLLLLGFAGCAKGIDPPTVSTMVLFGGPGYSGPALEFTFGDDTGCPEPPTCTEDVEITTPVYPTAKAKVAPFALDATEVTNFQYEYCVRMGACDDLTGYNLGVVISDYFKNGKYNDYPVVLATARNAEQYCTFAGQQSDPPVAKRLPTEVEWEFAMRAAGTNTKPWPWGNDRDGCLEKNIAARWCQSDLRTTAPVGTSTDDVIDIPGAGKLYDMMANVSEWMANAPDNTLTCGEDAPHCVPNVCEMPCDESGCTTCRADSTCGGCTGCSPACPEGSHCGLPTCVANDGTTCNPPCGPGRHCEGSVCKNDFTGCAADCAAGEHCAAPECLADADDCTPACAAGTHCDAGACVPDASMCNPPCSDDKDCVLVSAADGADPAVYACQATTCSPACDEDVEVCIAGNLCVPASCTDCTASERCASFDYECGDQCEASCGSDEGCKSNCRRCSYCKADALDGRDDCQLTCDLAWCVKKPANAVIPAGYDYLTGANNMIRGGNFLVTPGPNNEDKAVNSGTCAMRNSARFMRKDGTDSAEWVGFRCAMDL